MAATQMHISLMMLAVFDIRATLSIILTGNEPAGMIPTLADLALDGVLFGVFQIRHMTQTCMSDKHFRQAIARNCRHRRSYEALK
jgi:hypothetical protein